jgi:hypothetical protein
MSALTAAGIGNQESGIEKAIRGFFPIPDSPFPIPGF